MSDLNLPRWRLCVSRHHFKRPILGLAMLWALGLASAAGAEPPGKPIDFNRQIRPLLSNLCFKCHGPDDTRREAGLRLDTAEGAVQDLGGYAAIVPGQPDQSELIKRAISDDDDVRMPPPAMGKRLSETEVALLREWIRQGAPYARHWSYVKPERPPLPEVKHAAWPKNDMDRFLLARLERDGLAPSPEADRYTLIRRVSLDLTGLPPSLEEVEAFVTDQDPQAYEKLVDRLLASPAYGEHWARLWLDLARYADSAGYADDPPRTIWAYRDYVIRSLNDNKPFDQFTIEQIAGDLLPDPTEDQLIATAFHRNTLTNNEGGTNDEEFRNVAVVDRVNTTLAVWMGTTMACAQCHSHKYDPISQEEYFRFFAILNNTADADRRDESPLIELYSAEQKQQKAAWEAEIATLQAAVRTATPELLAAQAQWERGFGAEPVWQTIRPAAVVSQAGAPVSLGDQATVLVGASPQTDEVRVELVLDDAALGPLRQPGAKAAALTALRLDALTHDSLPNQGPGHAGGNFVITRLAASLLPPDGQSLSGRYVRIEIPGQEKILSLAEVQVFRGEENVARKGQARQSSTAHDGPPELAIDGNTDGHFTNAKSTTHTAISDDPWWEVDLQSVQPLDRIAVFNRTDGDVGVRLSNFRLTVLDAQRQPVWEQTVVQPPKPAAEFTLSGARTLPFTAAYADYSQSGFEPGQVLNNPDPAAKGWAIGPQTGQPHWLTLIAASPVELAAGAKLMLTIQQNSKFENHTLGAFRLSLTGDPRVTEFARTPANILAILRTPAGQRTEAQRQELTGFYLTIAPALQPQHQRLAELTKLLADLKPGTSVPILRELPEGQRRKTFLQYRGNFLDLGPEVTPGLPSAFAVAPGDEPPTRLTLARWLVDENNPLTARVIANRYWEAIFGIGIVSTSEEFGSQGELPTHPELLDWLATELIARQWDVKQLVRLLVTSAAYRQSSQVTPELLQRDPDNRLLARGPRFRMSAEMVRDQALAVSGLLSRKMHGEPVKPPQPALGLSAAFGSGVDWQTSAGEDRYRRGLYTMWRRSSPYPSLIAFDAPNREVCTLRRVPTNTPLQALVTLNDPVSIEAAQALARRMAGVGPEPADRARFGFRFCLARPPSEAELARLIALYQSARQAFAADTAKARQMATDPLGPAPPDAEIADLAAWTVVGNVLLNLDEMLMKK